MMGGRASVRLPTSGTSVVDVELLGLAAPARGGGRADIKGAGLPPFSSSLWCRLPYCGLQVIPLLLAFARQSDLFLYPSLEAPTIWPLRAFRRHRH